MGDRGSPHPVSPSLGTTGACSTQWSPKFGVQLEAQLLEKDRSLHLCVFTKLPR